MTVLVKNIKKFLEETGMTSIRLCRKAGVPKHALANILAGNSKNPSGELLLKLSRAMNCSVENLLDEGYSPGTQENNNSTVATTYIDPTTDFKPLDWDPELFEKILGAFKLLLREREIVIPANKALQICYECYAYMMKEEDGHFNIGFIRWTLSKEFPFSSKS